MSSASSSTWDHSRPKSPKSTDVATRSADRWIGQATWAFVVLGLALRIARYALDYPLWWDEAFVAVNFIRRDYGDLLRPLDYGQVCPVLFLWSELTLVKLLGFSEPSLRLFPLICALASVVLFRHAAGRVVRGVPLLVAVAIFATSFHPILHAADVKPYASDLLAALVLLTMALEWLRVPERAGWMWVMGAIAPIAIALSHPAVFVAAGTVLGLAPAVARAGRRPVWIAYLAFSLSTVSAFITIYFMFTHAQAAANLSPMQAQWGAAFPPLADPLRLLKWMVMVHTGGTFAYPCGGEGGASSLTFLMFVVGAGVLWYHGRKVIVLTCLAPFGMAIVAAALKRYPYGGPVPHGSPARIMQYLAPSICLLAGAGAAAWLALIPHRRRRRRALATALLALVAIGTLPVAADVFHPYRAIHAQRARQFARQFWPAFVRDAVPVCLRWDVAIGEWESSNLNVAVYLCNQRIYSPLRRHRANPPSQTISASRPLRCVLPLVEPSHPRVAIWLEGMKKRYRLKECRTVLVEMAEPGARSRPERYEVYEFVPPQVTLGDHRPDDPGDARIR